MPSPRAMNGTVGHVDGGVDYSSAPAAPVLQGFWIFVLADHPHT
jgi:hypothetical protein